MRGIRPQRFAQQFLAAAIAVRPRGIKEIAAEIDGALQRSQRITDRVSELGNFALEAANAQNWPQAMEQMNEAIKLCGSCAESAHLHKNLGIFYERTGNMDEAEKELRIALQLAPDDADAKNALAMLERIGKEQSK